MPLKSFIRPDGSKWWIRKAFDPKDYTVPKKELERLQSFSRWDRGSLDELDLHDGAFSAYTFVRRFERDGKPFVLLQNPREWAIEVELTRGKMGELRPLPPAEAWRLARESDTRDPARPIDFEGEPPP
jgi:hypothetical protein